MISVQDASHFQGEAENSFSPESEAEVVSFLKKAARDRRPVTISGAGTGLTGARVPQGGDLLCTDRMNRVVKIDWDAARQAGSVVVQPGVSLQALEEALEPAGLFYPPDPGEKKAFLGGTVSTNASGPRSLKYGPTRRWVRRLRVVLPQGELIELRRGKQKAKELQVPLPTYTMPACKNAAGYFSAPEMDAVDLFIGAEGTLGVITEIELEILRCPEAVLSGILFFDSEWDCFSFAQEARRLEARAVEFFDSRSLAFLSRKHPDLPLGTGGAIYFQQECRAAEFDKRLDAWERLSEQFNARPSDCWFARQEEDLRFFRHLRYDLPASVNEQVAHNGFQKVGTDFAVPAPQGRGMFKIYLQDLPASGLEFLLWGHLGEDHLHANFLPETQEEFDRAWELYGQLARMAVQLGGTVSAEHGIGKVRIPYLEMMVGREGLRQMARLKKALDPAGILNRGNIFPAELLDHV